MNLEKNNREEAKGTTTGEFRIILLLVLLLFALFAPSRLNPAALAQGDAPDEQTYRIAKQLNCPTCAGRNLADCPTETCAQWKAEIKAQLDQGKNAQEVLDYFQARFGPTVLQEPPKTGVTAPLWAVPVGAALVFLAGAIVVMTRVSRRSAPATSATSSMGNADPFIAELEREVEKIS
jgi:cytochrome c-type biogenesis protein CcmH